MDTFNLENEFICLVQEMFVNQVCSCCEKPDCMKTCVNKFFNTIPEGQSVALYGLGKAASALLVLLEPKNLQKISYYSDARAGEGVVNFNDTNAISPEELLEKNPDIVFLSSEYHYKNMKTSLVELGFDERRIAAPTHNYGDMVTNKFQCSNRFLRGVSKAIRGIDYPHLFEALEGYQCSAYCDDASLKEMLLTNLIFAYLGIRDIVNATKYIEFYVELRYSQYELFDELSSKLNQLLETAKQRIEDRKQDAIVIYLLDGFSENMAQQTNYIKSFVENSYNFRRAYTQYHFTTSSLQVMFTGRDLIDEGSCEETSFTEENSPLIKALEAAGYDLVCFQSGRLDLLKMQNTVLSKTISYGLWQMISRLAMDDRKSVLYGHFMESHVPYNNGYMNCLEPIAVFQFLDNLCPINQLAGMLRASKYIDEQLSFYDKLIPKTITKIIMSDHGQGQEYYFAAFGETYADPYTRACRFCKIMLSVQSPRINTGETNSIFTNKNFKELIFWLIGQNAEDSIYSKYSKLQLLPLYAENLIKHFYPKMGLPKRGAISSEGCYIIDFNGKEEFYPDGTEDNKIDDPEYASAIERARQYSGTDFHDIFNMPRFALSKKYYAEAGLIKENGEPL